MGDDVVQERGVRSGSDVGLGGHERSGWAGP